MILRLSHTLGSKIKAGTLQPMPLDANPYADWSCHLFSADRTQYILVANAHSGSFKLDLRFLNGPSCDKVSFCTT